MKRSLSVFLSLVLLVSSLVIPMSVSAETTIDSASLIAGIKTAATNLEYNENQREQPFVPLGIVSEDSNYNKVQDNVITSDDDKAVVGSKVIRIPNKYSTTKNFWNTKDGTDAVVSYQPGYYNNSSKLSDTNFAEIQKSQLKSISFTVKTNIKLDFVLKTHSGEGFNAYEASVEAAPGEWQTVKWNINDHYGNQTIIKFAFVIVDDENTSARGFGDDAEVYFGGFFVETVDENVTAVNDITGNDTTALADCIVAAEKIDTSRYTDATVTALKSAITAAKKALVSNYIENKDISSLAGFVDEEIKILSKTEILFVANFGRYFNDNDDKLDSTKLLEQTGTAADGYTSKYSYLFADENWRYMSGNLTMLHFVAPGYTSYTDAGLVGVRLDDYDDIYLYMVDNINKRSTYTGWFSQFGALKGTKSWIGAGVTDNNDTVITGEAMVAKLLKYLDSRNYKKTAAPLKTKMPIKLNGDYIINDNSYTDTALTKAFQAYKGAAFNTPCEVAFSPIYGVNYCKTTVADKTSINEVLTAVNSINVNEWDNGSIIKDTSKAMKEALLEDPSANLEGLKTILLSELSDAEIVEEVWKPRYQGNGTNWNDPVTNVSSSLSNIITGYKNELGSFVTNMNSSHNIVSLVSSDATDADGNGSNPINVDDYQDMWLYVYNNSSVTLTPNSFRIVSTKFNYGDAATGLTFPAKSLTRIDVAKILKDMNTVKSASDPNWDTNRIQFQIASLSDTQDLYCGTVLGCKKLDTTALAAVTTYADIFKFYDQNIKNKSIQNADDAISTFEAIRNSIATSGNFADIKNLLLYELGNVGTVEEIWRPMWSEHYDGSKWQWGKSDNAIDDVAISDYKAEFGAFAVKLDSYYQITSVTDAGAPSSSPDAGPFLDVRDYFDIWMYAYNNNSGTIKANKFMVVSAGSMIYGLTNPDLNNGLNRIELYNNLVAASTGIKADEDGTQNMVRLQIQYNTKDNTSKIPEGAAVYYGSVLGIKKIDTSELRNAKRMGDIIEFYDNNIGEKSLVDANGVASTEATNLVNSIRGGLSPINATLNDDTFVIPTDDCVYSLDCAKSGEEFKFKVEVKNGGSVNSVTYGSEKITADNDVYTITVDADKELKITTDRDVYAPVGGMLTVDGGEKRNILNHSTSNNQSTWSTKKDKINGESVVYQEPVLFYTDNGNVRSNVKLMYPVENIVAVTSYTTIDGEFVKYYKDKDFTITDDGKITLTKDTTIPTNFALNEMKTGITNNNGETNIWNGAGKWENELPKNQVLVTYTYTETWNDVDYEMPTYVNNLTTAYEKLNNEKNLDVLFIGDSITTGCNASGQDGTFYKHSKNGVDGTTTIQGWNRYLGLSERPDWVNDSWDKQVVANLKNAYPTATINSTNRAVGSSASEWYMNNIDGLLVNGSLGPVDLPNTDLVFIGFGMNEPDQSKDEHKDRIKKLINYLRDKNSNVSIVLVSAFYPTFWNSNNSTWETRDLDVYEDGYFELAKEYENIAVAPVNTAFANILKAKEGVDYIANGINHPNDYGVNLYANVINSTLVGSASIDAPNAMYLYNDNGNAIYTTDGDTTEKTAVYLFAQYKSPVDNEGKLDPTKIILSDGTEGTVVSRTIYLATKANAEILGDAFGKTDSTKVKSITVDGANLSKCWSSDTDNKLVTYGVKAHGIIKANSDKPLAVRAKIEYTVGTDKYTIYSNVRTSDYFSAQGAYAHLSGLGKAPGWFAN